MSQYSQKDVRLAGGVTEFNGRLVPYALAAICAAAFLGASWITADVNPLRPDTASYLYFDPSRPIGYPAFLWVVGLFGGPALAVPVQMLILTVSLFLLGWAFYRWTGSPLLSGLFQLALLVSPEMWKFSAALITEAPATAAVALWCAQMLRLFLRPSIRGIAVLALISGLAILVKPSLLPMFVGTAVAALFLQSRKERYMALAVTSAALLLSLAITPIGNYLLHGSTAGGSPLARGILQHSLFCPPSGVPNDRDSAFVEQHSKTVRDYIDTAPEETRPALQRMYTGKLRFGLIIPELGRRHGLQSSWQTDDLTWNIARQRVLASPACYARSVAGSYFSLATYKSTSSAEARRLRQLLETRPPPETPLVELLPRDEQMTLRAAHDVGAEEPSWPGRQDFEAPDGRPILLIWVARIIYGSAAFAGLVALPLLILRSKMRPDLSRLTIGVAAMGALFHGVFGLTALVELHLTRYTVPLWPVVCTMLALIIVTVLERSPWWRENRGAKPNPL